MLWSAYYYSSRNVTLGCKQFWVCNVTVSEGTSRSCHSATFILYFSPGHFVDRWRSRWRHSDLAKGVFSCKTWTFFWTHPLHSLPWRSPSWPWRKGVLTMGLKSVSEWEFLIVLSRSKCIKPNLFTLLRTDILHQMKTSCSFGTQSSIFNL